MSAAATINSIMHTTSISTISRYNTTRGVSAEERRRVLESLQAKTTYTMIPTFIFLISVAVVGLIGNLLILYVYSQRMTRRPITLLIIVMAFYDLMGSMISIPLEIYDMLHIWSYSDAILCKVSIFIPTVTTLSSATFLLAIAVTRYRKVCVPYGKQLTMRQAQVVSILIVFIGILASIPNTIISGRKTRQTGYPGVMSTECEVDDAYKDTIWPLIRGAFYVTLFVGSVIPLAYLYIRIGIKAWKHSKLYGVAHTIEAPTRTYTTEIDERYIQLGSKLESSVQVVTPSSCFNVENPREVSNYGGNVDNMEIMAEKIEKDVQKWSVNNSAEVVPPIIDDFTFQFKDSSGDERNRDHTYDDYSCCKRRPFVGADNGNRTDLENAIDLQYGVMADHEIGIMMSCDPMKEFQDCRRIIHRKRLDFGDPKRTLRNHICWRMGARREASTSWTLVSSRQRTKLKRALATLRQNSTRTVGGKQNCDEKYQTNTNDFAKYLKTAVPETSKENISIFSTDAVRVSQEPGMGDYFSVPKMLESNFFKADISHAPKSQKVASVKPRNFLGKLESMVTAENDFCRKDLGAPSSSVCRERQQFLPDKRSQSSENGNQTSSYLALVFGNSAAAVTTTANLIDEFKNDKRELFSATLTSQLSDANRNASDNIQQPEIPESTAKVGSEYTRPKSGSEYTRPKSGSEYTRPKSGSEYTRPKSGSEHTRPKSGSEHTRPKSEREYTQPNYGSVALRKFVQVATFNKETLSRPPGRRPMTRTTTMLCIITVIYVISYLPTLGLAVFKNLDTAGFQSMSTMGFFLYNFFSRTYFLHGGVNPIIYSLCDKDFRRECASVFKCRHRISS